MMLKNILNVVSLLMLIAFWIIVLNGFQELPLTIPNHFDLTGNPDGYGSRNSILALPSVATLLFILLTLVNKNPSKFNYPFTITELNAAKQYRLAGNFIRFLRISIVIVFMVIFFFTSGASVEEGYPHSYFLLPIVLPLVFLPVLIYLILAFRMQS
jgi:uncharacterized membrane protein